MVLYRKKKKKLEEEAEKIEENQLEEFKTKGKIGKKDNNLTIVFLNWINKDFFKALIASFELKL